MQLLSLFIAAAIATSINASVIVHHDMDNSIDRRDITEEGMFKPGGSKFFRGDSSSDSDGGASPPPSRGSSRSSSPEREVDIGDDPNFDIGDGGDGQLDRLGLTSAAERTAIENEHKAIVKQQMTAFGATRAEIEKLAHAKGSSDPNIHITATLYGYRKTKGGSSALVALPSNVRGERGHYHHIYVNPSNPADGLSVVRNKMPRYYAALQRKQRKSTPDVRRREEDLVDW